MPRALIYIEQDKDAHTAQVLAALALLHADAPTSDICEIYALVLDADAAFLDGKVDCILPIEAGVEPCDTAALADLVRGLHETYAFDTMLFSGSRLSSMLAARVAVKLDVDVIPDVIAAGHRNGKRRLVRACFGRNLEATVEVDKDRPLVATLKEGAFTNGALPKRTTQWLKPVTAIASRRSVRHIRSEPLARRDIRDSRILISGGGGIAHAFDSLQPLADALKADVSASRAAVDRGLAPKDKQVGQSGKRVSPDLYMAFGIHGAIQHVVALEDVETVIAVNTNANAPICSLCDICVVGDASTFANKLLSKIKEDR